jgi:hypothetical protein
LPFESYKAVWFHHWLLTIIAAHSADDEYWRSLLELAEALNSTAEAVHES